VAAAPVEWPGLAGLELGRADLSGRGILITGGSHGIGYACASEALAAGARVVIAARSRGPLEAAAARLSETYGGGRVHAVAADVGRESDVEALVGEAADVLSGIDGLVHAAAVLGPIGPALDVDPAEWFETVRIDLFGTFLVARAIGRSLRASGRGGRLVLLSGGGATSPFPNYTAYACSKAAVVRLVETLALEFEAYGIAVNALAPGFVATRMHAETLNAGERAGAEYLERTRRELEAGGVPVELPARAAVFLLSDRAEGINGRLVSAPWDRWWEWPERRHELERGDLFTLRRIVPRDRGQGWQ